MQLRIFTLRFSPYTESFDDSEVVGFLADKDVLSLSEHFFTKDGAPYLSVVVHYRTVVPPPALSSVAASEEKRDEAWRELLTDADWPLFNTIRAWRSERSKQDGVPPYVICNNQQLAEVIKARPKTLAALGRIQGFGEGKLKKYGNDMLSLLAGDTAQKEETKHVAGQ